MIVVTAGQAGPRASPGLGHGPLVWAPRLNPRMSLMACLFSVTCSAI